MNRDELRAAQEPIKARYRENSETAVVVMEASADVDVSEQSCRLTTHAGPVTAGLHPAAAGDGRAACSGDMLLESLAACAGVTLGAVATAMQIPIDSATVTARGELDFRGTLGVDRTAPVGFRNIRLDFQLNTAADENTVAKLVELTERYCVIAQTLREPPAIEVGWSAGSN